MRAHALVLLVVSRWSAPATPLAGEQSAADAAWAQGHQLVRRGDYAGAEQFYAAAGRPVRPAPSRRARCCCRPAPPWPTATRTPPKRSSSSCWTTTRAPTRSPRRTSRLEQVAAPRATATARCAPWTPSRRSPADRDRTVRRAAARAVRRQARRLAGRAGGGAGGAVHRGRRTAADAHRGARARRGGRAQAGPPAGRARLLQPLARAGRHAGLHAPRCCSRPPPGARSWARTRLAAERFRAVVVDYADQARAPGALDALDRHGPRRQRQPAPGRRWCA